MFKGMTLVAKQTIGFIAISVMIVVVGMIGYFGLEKINKQAEIVNAVSPLSEAVDNMLLSVVNSRLIIMEILVATVPESVDEEWKNQQNSMANFESSFDMFIKTVDLDKSGNVSPAKVKEVKNIADDYLTKFLPLVEQIYLSKSKELKNQKEKNKIISVHEKNYSIVLDELTDFVVFLYQSAVSTEDVEPATEQEAKELAIEAEVQKKNLDMWKNIADNLQKNVVSEMLEVKRYLTIANLDIEEKEAIRGSFVNYGEIFNQYMSLLLEENDVVEVITDNLSLDKLHSIQTKQYAEFTKNSNELFAMHDELVNIVFDMDAFDTKADVFGMSIEQRLKGVERYTKNLILNTGKESIATIDTVSRQLFITIVLSVFAAIVFGVVITKNITTQIRQVISQLVTNSTYLSDTSESISDSSQQLSSGASEQAASLEETSAAMEEMAAQTSNNAEQSMQASVSAEDITQLVQQNSENISIANNLSSENREAALEGSSAMTEIVASMHKIKDDSQKVADIIEVINDITHQTKMLATNAAIEAARAGDQGKGFAVVADEVSKLAESSKNSAKEIASLISQNSKNAAIGTELAAKGEKGLQGIVEKSVMLADLIEEVSASALEQKEKIIDVNCMLSAIKAASDEQASGVQEISRALTQMDSVTQQNANSAETTANSAMEVASQSRDQNSIVEKLAQLVGSKIGKRNTGVGSAVSSVEATPEFEENEFELKKPALRKTGNSSAKFAQTNESESKIPMKDDFSDFMAG